MKFLFLSIPVVLFLGLPAFAQSSVTCKADASGPDWYYHGQVVLRDGKPVEISQFVSGSGAAKVREGFAAFAAGTGEKKGWIRFDTIQNASGMRPSITLFSPGIAEDETVRSYRLKMKVGNQVLAELDATDGGWQNGWPTGTTYILSSTISDPAKLAPIFKAMDKAESVTIESYAVFVDRSVSDMYSSTYTVLSEPLRTSRGAASGVKPKIDAAIRDGKCTN